MAKKYDESTVLSLDALAHIRLRSGMYIGGLGDGSHPDDGIYVMLKEVIDNAVDEFIMGHSFDGGARRHARGVGARPPQLEVRPGTQQLAGSAVVAPPPPHLG